MVILGCLTIGIRIFTDDSSSSTTRGFTAWYGTHETYCIDSGNTFEFVKPSNARCSGILVVHDQLDQEQQSEDSRNMRGVVASSCLPTLRWRLAGEVVLFICQRNLHCSTRVDVLETSMCLSYSHFSE